MTAVLKVRDNARIETDEKDVAKVLQSGGHIITRGQPWFYKFLFNEDKCETYTSFVLLMDCSQCINYIQNLSFSSIYRSKDEYY